MVSKILSILSQTRVSLSHEKTSQEEIESALTRGGISFIREYRLSAKDIPDFYIDGIALEIKLRGHQKMSVFKQLERYAAYSEVDAVILATNMSMGLPEQINGKPAYYVSLGMAWV